MPGRYPPGPVVAADWSGAARHEDRHLLVAVTDADGTVVELAPATRAGALARILQAAEADARTIAGPDSSFPLPAAWLRRWGLASAPERLVKSDPGGRAAWVAARRERLTPVAAAAEPSDDALDAAAAALDLWERRTPGPTPADPVVTTLEGWIGGVPIGAP